MLRFNSEVQKNTCPTGITTHNPDLMKGPNITAKSERVANFVKTMSKDHSCGVTEPRQLTRHHASIVTQDNMKTATLATIYPYPQNNKKKSPLKIESSIVE